MKHMTCAKFLALYLFRNLKIKDKTLSGDYLKKRSIVKWLVEFVSQIYRSLFNCFFNGSIVKHEYTYIDVLLFIQILAITIFIKME